MGPLPKNLRPEASEALRLAEAVFYLSWRLLEVHLDVLYVSGRLQGGRMSNGPKPPGGSA